MRTRVKVCCIGSVAQARLAVSAGADALGLVARMPSGPGTIDDAAIRTIALAVPPPVTPILLTAETEAGAIADHVHRTGVAAVQIVTHIDPGQSERLAALMPGVRRLQVIHVEDAGALDLVAPYAPHVHAFLLDSGRPSAAVPELGGTGRVHDWSVSAAFVRKSPRPVFLAGGLHPGNVGQAIGAVRPFGVDLCSGLRTGTALDPDRLRAFMIAVRAADSI